MTKKDHLLMYKIEYVAKILAMPADVSVQVSK